MCFTDVSSCGGRLGPEPLSQGSPNLVFEGGRSGRVPPQAENAPSRAEGRQVKAPSAQLLAERREMVGSQRGEQRGSFFPRRPLFHRSPGGSVLSLALARLLSIRDLYWAFASAVPAG